MRRCRAGARERWVEYAVDEVSRWADTDDPGPGARTAEILALLAARDTVLGPSTALGETPGRSISK